MIDSHIDALIAELRACWPYQELPEKHLRHWRDTLSVYPRAVAEKVLADAKTMMKGRPSWSEFGQLCREYARTLGRQMNFGPALDDVWKGPDIPANEPGWLDAAAAAKAALRPEPAGVQP